jgi:hypothetical protein
MIHEPLGYPGSKAFLAVRERLLPRIKEYSPAHF